MSKPIPDSIVYELYIDSPGGPVPWYTTPSLEKAEDRKEFILSHQGEYAISKDMIKIYKRTITWEALDV
jgi:hypothetical protein